MVVDSMCSILSTIVVSPLKDVVNRLSISSGLVIARVQKRLKTERSSLPLSDPKTIADRTHGILVSVVYAATGCRDLPPHSRLPVHYYWFR